MPISIPAERIHTYLTQSLVKVLQTMAKSECAFEGDHPYEGGQALSPKIDPEKDPSTRVFAASVGFAGALNGVCYLFFGDQLAYHIAGKVTGIETDDLDDDTVRDVCGELTNMFAGTFKNALADLGLPSTLTVPTVIQGKRMAISTAGTSSQSRFEFDADGFPLYADLLLSEN